jgi:hypothetical protein
LRYLPTYSTTVFGFAALSGGSKGPLGILWEATARDFDLDLNDDISSFYACIVWVP